MKEPISKLEKEIRTLLQHRCGTTLGQPLPIADGPYPVMINSELIMVIIRDSEIFMLIPGVCDEIGIEKMRWYIEFFGGVNPMQGITDTQTRYRAARCWINKYLKTVEILKITVKDLEIVMGILNHTAHETPARYLGSWKNEQNSNTHLSRFILMSIKSGVLPWVQY